MRTDDSSTNPSNHGDATASAAAPSASPGPRPGAGTAHAAAPRRRWRTVDIVVAAVLAVACGLLFWLWGQLYRGVGAPVEAILPGFQGILGGPWFIGGVLAGLIIRKPGAAFFVEVVAASVSALVGTEWGALTLVSGIVQGLGAELAFAAFRYRRFTLPVAMLAGAGAGVAAAITDNIVWYVGAGPAFMAIYSVSVITSGALLAGIVSWLLFRAIAATGALRRFASGREGRS
ncbi:ABC transporter permease [Pseudoclavibacter endophyticus]|uniref:ECF transporter S component n=1 Tax=Pseudoclavibacter endophyticus TaxID=1778590 RepID=A0A6H9WEZ6_9MICO|nr:ECF transporter S component [Pseudoclavibacter endophyticus]KAB1646688.1 hypothetical protein F8O04_13115 [Pseudoclavibacter endophyticus]GGA76454.1 ABC transporter permease [Pseudoclavibacter endophyticus]